MDTPHGQDALRDFSEKLGLSESLTLEKLIRVAGFPVYGLVTSSDSPTLHGFGHSIVDPFVPPSDPPAPSTQSPYLWTVELSYDFAPPHPRFGQHAELITSNIHYSPTSESTVDDRESRLEARYPSPHDVPPMSVLPVTFVVEHLQVVDGEAEATVKYLPRDSWQGRQLGTHAHHLPDSPSANAPAPRPARFVVSSPASPTWSFTLRGPNMQVDGRAWGWTQDELFAVLGQVAVISDRAEIIAQYERELLAWGHYFSGDLPPV